MKRDLLLQATTITLCLTPLSVHAQWWERGRGFQNDYVYARAYCYGRGNGLNHQQAMNLAYSKDDLPEQTEKDKSKRLKKIATIILDFISGTGNNEEFTGCRRAHANELAGNI